jgi:tripartite tricarboxylate transporter TctB family protein
MILRADHVAGVAFVLFGVLIIAISGDLPTGQLSMPGSGFMPKIVAALTILLGLALIARASESAPFAEVGWSDAKHAAMVTGVTAAGIYLYTITGFLITMFAMIVALLVIVERRNPLRAGAYGLAIVFVTYACFSLVLKTPLPSSALAY